jgi:hypothetical protein
VQFAHHLVQESVSARASQVDDNSFRLKLFKRIQTHKI